MSKNKKRAEVNKSFLFEIVDFDHIKKIYTLKNRKNGRIIKLEKDDFDARFAEQQKTAVGG